MNTITITTRKIFTRFVYVILIQIITTSTVDAQTIPLYKNSRAPINERVKDLLDRMTPTEKFWQLFMIPGDIKPGDAPKYKDGLFGFQVSAASAGGEGAQQMLQYNATETAVSLAKKVNAIQRFFMDSTRLGIPMLPFDEALHGLVRQGSTIFPQSIGLAATFKTSTMEAVAGAIAKESKIRGIRQILSPVINIATDVRWGRTEETYGEDPFLSSKMGVAYMKTLEDENIIATPKHFVANVGDGGRDSYPIDMNERYLSEIHYPPFKDAVQKAGARSIMTSYNSVNGSPATANDYLLNNLLKKQWGFNGFVISDAGAVGGANVLHYTAKDYPDAGKNAVNNGLDVIFQTAQEHYKLFIPPFLNGQINQERLDDAVSRVLRAKFELGLFETPYLDIKATESANFEAAHKKIALEAALESVVLLQNKNALLPISTATQSIAIIGTDASEARLGGYSGPGTKKVSILDGMLQKYGASKIITAAGPGRDSKNWNIIPSKYLWTTQGNQTLEGLTAQYFNGIEFGNNPTLQRIDKTINFHWTISTPDQAINPEFFCAKWTGNIRAPKTGTYKIGLSGNDGFKLYINNQLIINNWDKQSFHTSLVDYNFTAGNNYPIRVEFKEPNGNSTIKLIWNVDVVNTVEEKITEAVAVAQKSKVAVVVVGLEEGEFRDRASLQLPGEQEQLIQRVAATGTPTVVVIVGGSAVTMGNWMDKVSSIVDVWYPGEEGGHAVAAVLSGAYNPGGKLPITFPVSEAQLPLVYNHKPTGRGDDYENLTGLPLFPFGYGLSYTSFEYSNLIIEKPITKKGDRINISFVVTNTGKLAGDEVAQLYLRDQIASVARPVQALKGFERIHLAAGASKTIKLTLHSEDFEMLNEKMETVIEPGDFTIMIGSSSRDIRLKKTVTLQ
ncbi:MAG: glycoside hydrolase family 3 C-terminal domain-containing protein [Sediminibacterium sp.]|nr:glycoside hydrolase family 3 C-terminal domain-containing protein [Sediminibacterium sp.]